jgi:hypothetical protein
MSQVMTAIGSSSVPSHSGSFQFTATENRWAAPMPWTVHQANASRM